MSLSTPNYESILIKILPELNNINDLNGAKKLIYTHISSSEINDYDKIQISCSLNLISSTKELDTYIHNSILYYEGHSINKYKVKKRKPKSKNYFTQETEDAIVLYNNTLDPILKSKIYEKKIHYAFFKLTQNIIHTFKFYHTEVEDLEHLQHEIIVFLLSKIHLFNPENGAKAYSYFGTIVKRWCILYNDKNYKSKIKKVSIIELEQDDSYSYTLETSSPQKDKLSFFIDQYVNYTTENIYNFFPKEYDAKIADAILELFRKRDQIDIFNKKALYIYIHEMIPNAKTPKITKIANLLYSIFKKNYLFYLDQGYIEFQSL
jgi:hypothetical protein